MEAAQTGAPGTSRTGRTPLSGSGLGLLPHQVDGEAVGVLGRLTHHFADRRMGVNGLGQITNVEIGRDRQRALVNDLAGLGPEDMDPQHLVGAGVADDLHEPGDFSVRDVSAMRPERDALEIRFPLSSSLDMNLPNYSTATGTVGNLTRQLDKMATADAQRRRRRAERRAKIAD